MHYLPCRFRHRDACRRLIACTLPAAREIVDPFIGIVLTNQTGIVVYSDSNRAAPFPSLGAGSNRTLEVTLPSLLPTGSYNAQLIVGRVQPDRTPVRIIPNPIFNFYVDGRRNVRGAADLDARFESRSNHV